MRRAIAPKQPAFRRAASVLSSSRGATADMPGQFEDLTVRGQITSLEHGERKRYSGCADRSESRRMT